MNIVVVCGSYMPTPSAVGICAKNVVDELCHRGHRVTVICERSAVLNLNAVEMIDGAIIKRVSTETLDLLYGNRFQKFICRTIYYAQAIFSRKNIDWRMVQSYERAMRKNHEEQPIDVILPFCFPYESIVAALNFKKTHGHGTYVAPVIFDNFIENPKKHRLKLNMRLKRSRHLAQLRRDIAGADRVYFCHSQEDFIDRELVSLKSKISLIEHPLFIRPKYPITSGNMLLYSGSFLTHYVKSADFAKVLALILPTISQNVEFCVMGNDLKPIKDLANRFPRRILNHGRVSYAIAEQKIAAAGILLSVGEVSGIQMSSKIFTYMTTGKPIIHFYYSDTDINKEILERYPLAHSFQLGKSNEGSLVALSNFIRHNCGKRLLFEEIAYIYKEALPATLVDKVLSEL